MASNKTDLAKQLIVGSPSEWIKPFDVNKFIGNPPLIEKLWEERQLALTENIDLKHQIKTAESKNHGLELENQKLSDAIDSDKQKSVFTLILAGFATVLTGFGINLITNDLQAKQSLSWIGVVLIILGSVAEGFAIFININKRKK